MVRQRSDVVADGKRIAQAQGVLLDWDGCVAIDNRILPSARRFIDRFRDRLVILTNNSSHLPEDIAAWLADDGVSFDQRRILTAGVETVRWAVEQGHARAFLIGSQRIRRYAREQGVTLTSHEADLVLLMRDAGFTYQKLSRAVNALQRGARLVIANADRTHPGADGTLVPETGALAAAVRACVPDVAPVFIGKPARLMFERACAVLNIPLEKAVMVGDNPETDAAGAQAVGMPSVLVGNALGTTLDDLLL